MLDRQNLHPYQEYCVNRLTEQDRIGLFLDMGLGKTVSVLTAAYELLYEQVAIDSALVVAPKRVVESVWTSEISKWSHLSRLKTSRIIGTAKQRKIAMNAKADIYLVSRDNLAWLIGQYGGSMLPYDMLIIDESSSFKNYKSVRFKALRKVLASFSRIAILSGTPAPNSLIDLWSQIFILDQGEALGRFITHYRREYFTKGAHLYSKFKIVSDGEARIFDKIKHLCVSMKSEDYLDLPGRINNYIKLKFPPKLKDKYEAFERDNVLELLNESETDEITAANAAGLSNKLLQFANGAVYDEDREVHEIHTLKLDAAEEIVESAQGKPVLIAWTYRHDFTRLIDRLKAYKPRALKTDKDVRDWNAGKIRVMMMHPASGGHGLNLQTGGNIGLWFGQTWSLELYEQWNKRMDRQGQTEVVIIHHLISEGTIDEDVIKATDRKAVNQNSLMSAIKARIKKYR